jgi:hypothetical protein
MSLFTQTISGHGATAQEASTNLRKHAQVLLGVAATQPSEGPAAPTPPATPAAKGKAATAAAKAAPVVNRLEEIQSRMKALAQAYVDNGTHKKAADAGAAVRAEVLGSFKAAKAADIDVIQHAAVCALLDALEAKVVPEAEEAGEM